MSPTVIILMETRHIGETNSMFIFISAVSSNCKSLQLLLVYLSHNPRINSVDGFTMDCIVLEYNLLS